MTAPLTVLDEQTRNELQPPCEATQSYWHHEDDPAPYRVDECPDPAEQVVAAVCAGCGGVDKTLLCSRHAGEGLAGRAVHGVGGCDGALTVVSVVRL